METKINRNWWFLVINGIIAILFGVLLVFFSREIIETIILWAGIFILVSGFLLLFIAIGQLRQDKKVAMTMFQSVAAIALGLIMLLFRENTLAFFLIVLGVWAVIIGIFQLVILINLPKTVQGKNILLFNGLLTMALGIFLILKPIDFASVITIITGVLSAIFGVGMIWLAIMIRKAPLRNDLTNA